MGRTKIPKHIHKYILIKKNYTNMWKCGIAGCPHIMYAHLRDALIGRFSLCNTCGKQFVLIEEDLDIPLPECAQCKLGIEIVDMDELMKMPGFNEE